MFTVGKSVALYTLCFIYKVYREKRKKEKSSSCSCLRKSGEQKLMFLSVGQ